MEELGKIYHLSPKILHDFCSLPGSKKKRSMVKQQMITYQSIDRKILI
jgi:hypothetical protein